MPDITVTSLPLRLQRQVDQARTAIDRGNMEYAVNICRIILESHPGCLPVRRLLRAAHLRVFRSKKPLVAKLLGGIRLLPALLAARSNLKRDPAQAMVEVERALGADPTHVGALRLLATAARRLDLPETAVFALESLRESQPKSRAVLVELAEAYIAAGRTREGLAIAESLLAETPGDSVVQELLKNASVAQSITAGRWDSGSGTFRDKLRDEDQAVALEQDNRAVKSEDVTQRQIDSAIAALEQEPASLNHHRTIINGCRSLGRLDEALVWLGRARVLPTGAADVTLEKLESDLRLAMAENRVNARESTVRAQGGDPAQDEELRRLRADLVQTRIATQRAFAEKYPNDHTYKFDLGRLYREAGQIDLAIQQFQQAQRHPRFRIPALMQLGACFQAKDLFDLAVQHFEGVKTEIVAFDEQKKEAIYQLGCCFEAMGQPARAGEEFKLIYSWDIGYRDVAAKIDRYYPKA
jgi:tetratricopeptide (TPR) repeat protein